MWLICRRTANICFSTSKFNSYKQIPLKKTQIQTNFMRSSGPGGQSVNTTNSKAQAKITINQCESIDETTANKIRLKYANNINKEGQLVVRSQVHKSQGSNLEQCIVKLKKIIYQCSMVEPQRKFQLPVETDQNREKRLESKKKRSEVKKNRQNKFDY